MYRLPALEPVRPLRRIALLTSGGDAPGMNAAIRAVVRSARTEGVDVLGYSRGFTGLVNGDMRPLTSASVASILHRGGTQLKSDRCDAFREAPVRWQCAEQLREMEIDGLVVIGGDGSLTGARLLYEETGFPVIGIPATIDNDIQGSDETIGFDTAVNTALDAIDRIRDTANSHERLFLVEVMGRNSGFIAAQAGIAGGAELILVPERRIDLDQVCRSLRESRESGKASSSIILVAEGRKPGRTQRLAQALEERGHEPRLCILGHTQRGGNPTGRDRVLASCLGTMAVAYLANGQQGVMLGIQDRAVVAVPLAAIGERQQLDPSMLDLALTLQR
ncbi:6-phosphofructokinase [Motiliproteus sediminis]|uniref:6-phosphofructokinase n=1 Tax=Motiliproteus sediminis TaxID=1468178 RepID=UPI001AEFAE5A|nr:6-phosphofructokinase [Motiliproteus sediminis]